MAAPLLLGIEIGGTKLQLALGRGDGRLFRLERRTVDPSRGSRGIRDQIAEAFERLRNTSTDRIDAVGIGFGGPIDAETGVVTVSNQVAGWQDFPLAAWTRDTLGVHRVAVGNDADTAALGEARFGAGIGVSPVLYVTIGSGIGGGLILNGAIYRGSGAGATEIGHLLLDALDPLSSEPSTLEGLASGWAIGRRARAAVANLPDPATSRLFALVGGEIGSLTATHVGIGAADRDPLALAILDTAQEAMARALGSAVTLLAPKRIILGGGVSLMGESLWFEPIRRRMQSRVFAPFLDTYEVVPAALGEEVVLHGAMALALDLLPQ